MLRYDLWVQLTTKYDLHKNVARAGTLHICKILIS
jgi:hypothetical protein